MIIDLCRVPVFYINLEQDWVKNDYMQRMLERLGFSHIHRVDAYLDNESGRRGLSKSQHKALTLQSPPFIVMEDDCDVRDFKRIISIPEDTDALYLGNSAWGQIADRSGFLLKYEKVEEYEGLYRILNMLSSHAILYLSEEYVKMCQRTTHYCGYVSDPPLAMDIPFADLQKYFHVYTFNDPMFVQKPWPNAMSDGYLWTNQKLTDYRIDDSDIQGC